MIGCGSACSWKSTRAVSVSSKKSSSKTPGAMFRQICAQSTNPAIDFERLRYAISKSTGVVIERAEQCMQRVARGRLRAKSRGEEPQTTNPARPFRSVRDRSRRNRGCRSEREQADVAERDVHLAGGV